MQLALKKDFRSKEIQIFGFLLYLNIIMQLVESVVPFPFSVFELLYCISVLYAIKIVVSNISSIKELFREMWRAANCVKGVLICLSLYIVFDLISFTYTSDVRYAATKYIVIFEMLVLLVLWLFYMVIKASKDVGKEIDHLLLALAATEVIISVISILNYWLEFFPLIYHQRLSTYRDYNQFATLILFGYIAGIWLLLRKGIIYWKKYLWIALWSFYSLSVLYLVSSRRTFLIMMVVTAVWWIYLAVTDILLCKEAQKWKKFIILLILSVGVYFISTFVCEGVQALFQERYEQSETTLKENSADDNMDTIASGDFMNKRVYIWEIAMDELRNFEPGELLIGKGSSYQSDIYDMESNRDSLADIYHLKEKPDEHWMFPHNFLLSDMLSGGIIKTLLSMSIIICIAVYLLQPGKLHFREFLFLLLLFGVVYLNAFISYQFGYAGDKNYWLVLIIFWLTRYQSADMKEK